MSILCHTAVAPSDTHYMDLSQDLMVCLPIERNTLVIEVANEINDVDHCIAHTHNRTSQERVGVEHETGCCIAGQVSSEQQHEEEHDSYKHQQGEYKTDKVKLLVHDYEHKRQRVGRRGVNLRHVLLSILPAG